MTGVIGLGTFQQKLVLTEDFLNVHLEMLYHLKV